MIGLWGSDPFWQGLLRQEGVNFRMDASPRPEDLAVLVLDSAPARADAGRVRDYVENGGCALVCSGHAAVVWPELSPRPARLRWIAPDRESPLFRNVGIVDLHTRGWLLPDACAGITDHGAKAVSVRQQGRGWRILLPFDAASVLADHSAGPKQFWADAPRFPYDTVARISRGEVRRLVANCLRFLLAQKGLPYAHLSYVPGDSDSVFGFRIDTDFGPLSDIEAGAELAQETGMKFSWYVNTRPHAEHLATLKQYAQAGQDVQLHCYRHTVYPDFERNLRNFEQGRNIMLKAGLPPVGVVAPYGEWNPALGRAFTELGFEYSSEFCYAYDDLPGRPVISGPESKVQSPKSSGVLQMPVHPICIGRLVAARASRKQMEAYFRRVVDVQAARLEPCFLYDHPERIAQFGDMLAAVLSYGKERCGAQMTLTEYAHWWRRREKVSFSVRPHESRLDIECEASDPDVFLVIEKGGRFARVRLLSCRLEYEGLKWQALPEPVKFAPASLAARKPSPRLAASDRVRRIRKTLQGRRS